MLKLCFYVPAEHLEQVKAAVFEAGAGRMGNYRDCCWQVAGQGQFYPMEGADPTIGEVNQLETVMEYKVEMICEEACIRQVVEALIEAHPYEAPAYDVFQIMSF